MEPLTTTVASPPLMRLNCPVTAMLVRETDGRGIGTYVPVRLSSSFCRSMVNLIFGAPLSKSFILLMSYLARTSTTMLPIAHCPVTPAITFLLSLP